MEINYSILYGNYIKLEDWKREYEMFLDTSYYDMFCVRDIRNKDFNSNNSWHFATKDKAEQFLELINEAY
jgi:hypothetical protein